MSARICSYCGRENAQDAVACQECGTKFASTGGEATGESPASGTLGPRRSARSGLHHEWALAFAICHCTLSLLIGAGPFLYFFGEAMSDAYHSSPFWVNALLGVLWVLQTPAVLVERLMLRHAQHGVHWLLLTVLGVLWSLGLGYALEWARACRRATSGNRQK